MRKLTVTFLLFLLSIVSIAQTDTLLGIPTMQCWQNGIQYGQKVCYEYSSWPNSQPSGYKLHFSIGKNKVTLNYFQVFMIMNRKSKVAPQLTVNVCNSSGNVIGSFNNPPFTFADTSSQLTFSLTTPLNLEANTNYYLSFNANSSLIFDFPFYRYSGWDNGTYFSNLTLTQPFDSCITMNNTYLITPSAPNFPQYKQQFWPMINFMGSVCGGKVNVKASSLSPSYICSGQTATLIAKGVTSFTWSTGSTSPTIAVVPSTNTVYSVTSSAGPNCSYTSNVIVNVHPSPDVQITSSTPTIDAGQTASITVTPPNSSLEYAAMMMNHLNYNGFDWYRSEFAGSMTFTVNPVVSTTYTVTGIDNYSKCTNTVTFCLAVSNGIKNNIIYGGKNQVICAVGNNTAYPTTTVSASNPTIVGGKKYSYQWQTLAASTTNWTNCNPKRCSLTSNILATVNTPTPSGTTYSVQSVKLRRLIICGDVTDTSNVVELSYLPSDFSPSIELEDVSNYYLNLFPTQQYITLTANIQPSYPPYNLQWIWNNNGNIVNGGSSNPAWWSLPPTSLQSVSVQVSYGSGCPVSTASFDIVTDADKNFYFVVPIGEQTWLSTNLRTTSFNNGMPIIKVRNPKNQEWANFSWYNDDARNEFKCGALYNQTVIRNGTGLNVCPIGYRVANYFDWMKLFEYLGGIDVAANKLKLTGAWNGMNNGSDPFNFAAKPSGKKQDGFTGKNIIGAWWGIYDDTYPYNDPQIPVYFEMVGNGDGRVYEMRFEDYKKMYNHQYSIRCIK